MHAMHDWALAVTAGAADQPGFASSARAVAFLAQCVEWHHGSSVDDFQPLLQLTTQLAKPALLVKPATAMHTAAAAPLDAASTATGADGTVTDEHANTAVADGGQDFVFMSLSEQSLRLMQAIVFAHEQVQSSLTCCSSVLGCVFCVMLYRCGLHVATAWQVYR